MSSAKSTLRASTPSMAAVALKACPAQGQPKRNTAYATEGKEILMPEVLDDRYGEPGRAMRAVAENLAAHGFRVHRPEWEESRCLTITNVGSARCELTVEDGVFVRWDYWPRSGRATDPAEVTGLALRVLGAEGAGPEPTAPPGVSLMGLVGRALDARGLNVGIEVYADPVFYDVAAEIVVQNPAQPERGQVRVSEDGDFSWECHYYDEKCGDAGKIADSIVRIFAEGIAASGGAS